jgi:vesicle-associated membrane protein 7
MQANVERVMERGEKLEHLTDRSNALAEASAEFRTNARAIKRAYCRRNCKLTIILIVVVVVIIIVVIMIVCGAPSFSRCRKWANKAKQVGDSVADKVN